MTHVSPSLPPVDAPLSEKLSAAMEAAGYSAVRLARELGTDRKHVGRWLKGETKTITAPHHLERLPEILGTEPRYFSPPATPRVATLDDLAARMASVEEVQRELLKAMQQLSKAVGLNSMSLDRITGRVPGDSALRPRRRAL